MKIGVLGLGLMGASLARAFTKYTPHAILGYDKSDSVNKYAVDNGVCAEIFTVDALKTIDVLYIALNESDVLSEIEAVCPYLKDGATVVDICGVKRRVVAKMRDLRAKYGNLQFVASHPMAGREFSGIQNSTSELFGGASVLITPIDFEFETPQNDYLYYKNGQVVAKNDVLSRLSQGAKTVADLYISAGAKQIRLVPFELHDAMIAYTSQLAHIVSASYIKNPLAKRHDGFSAGSFGDLTRVARLNSDMWAELFIDNSDNLLSAIDDISFRLSEYRSAIANKDGAALKKLLDESTALKNISDQEEQL